MEGVVKPTNYKVHSNTRVSTYKARKPVPKNMTQFNIDVEVENLNEDENFNISCVKTEPDYDLKQLHDNEIKDPDKECGIIDDKALIQEQIRTVDVISHKIYDNVEQTDETTHDTSVLPINVIQVESDHSLAQTSFKQKEVIDDALSQGNDQDCKYNMAEIRIEDDNEILMNECDYTEDDKKLIEEIRAVNEISFGICRGKIKTTAHALKSESTTNKDNITLRNNKHFEHVEDINREEEILPKTTPDKTDSSIKITSPKLVNRSKDIITVDNGKVFTEIYRSLRCCNTDKRSTIDMIISTEAINIWMSSIHQITSQKLLLQNALDVWSVWVKAFDLRSSPVFYKCYICDMSWWHLNGLREHICKHQESDLKVSLEETSLYDCNIILHLKPTCVRDLATEGRCPKCFRDSSLHSHGKGLDSLYRCRGCNKSQRTCALLREHEMRCDAYITQFKGLNKYIFFVCKTCRNRFISREEFDDHVLLAHSPRSDLPIYVETPKKPLEKRFFCSFCSRIFSTEKGKLSHVASWTGNSVYVCNVKKCKQKCYSKCQLVKHYVSHSDTYVLAHRCVLCRANSVILLDDEAITAHFKDSHSTISEKWRRNCIEFVYIPRMFLKVESPQLPRKVKTINDVDPNNLLMTVIEPKEPINNFVKSLINSENVEDMTYVKEEPSVDNNHDIEQESNELTVINNESTLEEEEVSNYEYYLMNMLNVRGNDDIDIFNTKVVNYNKNTEQGSDNNIIEEKRTNLKRKQECNKFEHASKFKLSNGYDLEISNQTVVKEEYKDSVDCDETKNNDVTKKSSETNPKFNMDDKNNDGFKLQTETMELVDDNSIDDNVTYGADNEDYRPTSDIENRKKKQSVYKCAQCPFSSNHERCSKHKSTKHEVKSQHKNQCSQKSNADAMIVDNDDTIDDNGKVNQYISNERKSLSPSLLTAAIDYLKTTRKVSIDCLVCGKILGRLSIAKRHIIEHLLLDSANRAQHIDSGLLICQICEDPINVNFRKADDYRLHMRRHAMLPTCACTHCGRCFSSSSTLIHHRKIHDPKAFACKLCGKLFQTDSTYKMHLKIHDQFGTKTCDVCGIVFSEASIYKRHMRNHLYHVSSSISNDTSKAVKGRRDHTQLALKIPKNYVARNTPTGQSAKHSGEYEASTFVQNQKLSTTGSTPDRRSSFSLFGDVNEKKLCKHIKEIQSNGFNLTIKHFREIAFKFAEQLAIKNGFKVHRRIGLKWVKRFLKRYPDVTLRTTVNSYARREIINRFEVNAYFERLENTLNEHDLYDKPGNIFNIDVISLQMNNRPAAVAEIVGKEQEKTITVIACCNAEGNFLPPACIIDEKRNKYKLDVCLLPAGSTVFESQRSRITSDVFLEWMKSHFLPRKPLGKVLLLLNGRSTHCYTVQSMQFANGNNIILQSLPSLARYLRPLTVFKADLCESCKLWMEQHPRSRMSRCRFATLLNQAWTKSACGNSIESSGSETTVECYHEVQPDHRISPLRDSGGTSESQAVCDSALTKALSEICAKQVRIRLTRITLKNEK